MWPCFLYQPPGTGQLLSTYTLILVIDPNFDFDLYVPERGIFQEFWKFDLYPEEYGKYILTEYVITKLNCKPQRINSRNMMASLPGWPMHFNGIKIYGGTQLNIAPDFSHDDIRNEMGQLIFTTLSKSELQR